MSAFWQDVRYTLRVWRSRPGLVAVALASLALGVGANAIMFSLVDGMFLRPLPVQSPDELVWLEWRTADGRSSGMAWADYQALRETGGAFADIAAQNRRGGLLDTGGDRQMALLTIVSDNYFPLLGIQPSRGRLFRADLDEARSGEPAVAISDGLWQSRFGADPELVGRSITVNGRALTVVGILPPGFRGLSRGVVTDLWIPVSSWRALGNAREFEERVTGQFEPLARLASGVSQEAAQAQMDVFSQRMQQEHPEAARGRRLVAQSQAEIERGGRGRLASALLLSITGLLVLIASANVAVLLLALADARAREVAMRQALGAGRGRLFRQLMTESVMLALAGAAVALVAARWLIPLLPALLPPGPDFVRYDIRLDGRVVVAMLATTTVTIVLFGLLPALRGSRHALATVVRAGGGTGGSGRHLGRHALVAAQAMLAVTLLSSAGLLAGSFLQTARLRPGFDPDRPVILMLAGLSGPRDRMAAQSDAIAERVAGLPGMARVAYCRRFPMADSGGGATRDVVIPGRSAPPDQQVLRIRFNQVNPDYFAVTGTRLLAGRAFTRADTAASAPVALASDTMARQFWPGTDVVGQWIRVAGADLQIVGVVEDVVISSLHERPEPFLYFPFVQAPVGEVTFLFEAAGDPVALLPAIKREMQAVAPGYVPITTTTLRQHMKNALYQDRVPAVLAATIAIAGMALAAAGLFGVIVHTVSRRSREFGVRAAVGAQRTDLVAMVIRQGLVLAGSGALAGVALSLAAGRAMSGMLFGVNPFHPGIIAASVFAVVAIGLVASLYPAWMATRVDPVTVLRAE